MIGNGLGFRKCVPKQQLQIEIIRHSFIRSLLRKIGKAGEHNMPRDADLGSCKQRESELPDHEKECSKGIWVMLAP
jgi:hypothetical protein